MERCAGLGSGITDEEYAIAGAEIVADADDHRRGRFRQFESLDDRDVKNAVELRSIVEKRRRPMPRCEKNIGDHPGMSAGADQVRDWV